VGIVNLAFHHKDWNMFVTWQERAVGPELLPDIGGVVDANIEVGEVADMCRKV
jgi:hypothetical protein